MGTSTFMTLLCFSNWHSLTLSKTLGHFIFISKVCRQVNFDKDMGRSLVSPWWHRNDFCFVPMNPYLMVTHFHHHYDAVMRRPFSGALLGEVQPCAEQTVGLRLQGSETGRGNGQGRKSCLQACKPAAEVERRSQPRTIQVRCLSKCFFWADGFVTRFTETSSPPNGLTQIFPFCPIRGLWDHV